MNQKKFLALTATTAVVLAAGVWISMHRSNQQSDLGGATMFADLKPALGEVSEVHVSKGDGSHTTLRKAADGWTVVERQYPADASRVRELVLNLASLKVVERKTQDPANYTRLGVEAPDSPTAASTLVEVVAGKKTWSLIIGKGAEGRAVYVRKPAEAMSVLAQPFITVDPDQKRWIDRLLVDIPGASVHEVAVKPSSGPAYVLARATQGATDLTVSPVPKGRTVANSMSLSVQTDALVALHFDDVRAAPSPAAAATDVATYQTFDGQVITFSGHRDGEKAFVTVDAHRDAELAAKSPPEPPATTPPAPAGPATPVTATPATATPAKATPADQTVEKLAPRAKGMEFEIPAYKYEAIFRKPEELLEKLPEPVNKPVALKKPAATKKK
jgi:hypothetical protein